MRAKKHISARKNPPPQFFKEIESLVGKTVQVRSKSDHGFLSIIGKLEKFITWYKIVIMDKLYQARVMFKLYNIKNIQDNIIDLNLGTHKETPENLSELPVNKYVKIIVNRLFFVNEGLMPTEIKGKLKYNTRDKIFYIQNYDLTIILSFKPETIYIYNNYDIWVNI